MNAFGYAMLFFVVMAVASILAMVLAVSWWTICARKKSRLE